MPFARVRDSEGTGAVVSPRHRGRPRLARAAAELIAVAGRG